MGGSARAPHVMMIGWGEGGDQAARFLNTQPDAANRDRRLRLHQRPVLVFLRRDVTLPLYFRARSRLRSGLCTGLAAAAPVPPRHRYYAQHEPMPYVTIDGLDYAHIYDLRDLPLPDYVTDWATGSDRQDAIRLVSYQLPAAAISPGDSFRAIFYLVNLAPIDTNLNVLVRIVGPDGQELARSEGWPWGAATSDWQLDEIWPDGHELADTGGRRAGLVSCRRRLL